MKLQDYSASYKELCTVKYARIYILNQVITQEERHLEYTASDPNTAQTIVNTWNRQAVMQFSLKPENGLWVYLQES